MNKKAIDVTHWKRIHHDQKHPFWWGIWGLIAVELIVVSTFLTCFYYTWVVNLMEVGASWPPADLLSPPLFYPSINTFLLFICGLSMYYGGKFMDKGQSMRFFWTTVICCLAGGAVLFLRWLQFQHLPFSWDEHSYTSFVYLLTGFHFFHVASAVIGTAIIGGFAYKGFYTKERQLAVKVDTFYWYFVVVAWLPMYFSLYWAIRWSQ